MMLVWWLFLALLSPSLGQLVDTEYGQVQGHTVTLADGTVINSFLAIPFAKPPVDDLRFRRTEAPDPWDEPFVADTLSTLCPQGLGLLVVTHPLWNRFSEDCLTLNVFAPNDTSGGPYPVMVWFHGGAYTSSGNIQYPGHFLAQKGVVVVVPNYRVGALGYMSTMDDVARGNWGLHDQIFSLKFVQNNILNFGGDPTRVTVFGQSAGGSSIGLMLLAEEEAAGLFHRAICQSGSEMSMWASMGVDQEPRNYTQQVAAKLDCPLEDSQAMIDCLRTINATILRENQGITCKPGYFCQNFAPVVDGELIRDHPWQLREQGRFLRVPLMSGITSEDGSFYTVGLIRESLERGFNRTEWLEILRNRLVSIFAPNFPEREEDVYKAFDWYYSPWPHINDLDRNRQQFTEMINDVGFGFGSDQQIKSQVDESMVYFYEFGLRSENASELVPEWMGVPHNGDLPYVIGYPLLRLNPEVRVDSGIVIDIIDWTPEDAEWTDYVQTLFTNFAKFGNPTPTPVQPPRGEPVSWVPFNKETYDYIHINYDTHIRQEFWQKNFALYRNYLSWMTGIEVPVEASEASQGMDGEAFLQNLDDFYLSMYEARMKQLNSQ